MKYLTKIEFYRKCTGPYWRNQQQRWMYLKPVIDILKASNAQSVLELGNNGINLTDNSDTMNFSDRLDKNLTYHIDATKVPWNIPDKKYDFFVALQVFEHLDPKRMKQVDVFNEACRVAKNVVISIPYCWRYKEPLHHNNIGDKIVRRWASYRPFFDTILVKSNRLRKIYWWLTPEGEL